MHIVMLRIGYPLPYSQQMLTSEVSGAYSR
jgi:hypothetical protein